MKKFLTLKHWQIFGLLLITPIVFDIITFGSVINNNESRTIFYLFPIMMILCMGVFFGWFYALGTNLHKKLPGTVSMNLTRFKLFLITPVTYIALMSVFMMVIFPASYNDAPLNPSFFALIIPLHLFSMFCIFYCLYFIAKALKAVELQQPVTFGDFAGEFFLIWFFPIGIWIIQPRINKLFEPTL